MKSLLSRRVLAVVLVIAAVLFLARPSAERLRGRVARALGQALGRRVEIGSLHLRFLPRPGFDLGDLIIYDDPAFGEEPLVRAAEVGASLRLTALLRRRIEISDLVLGDASLNLARDAQGQWNLEELIDRASRVAVAPTSASQAGRRPRFPYVEASQSRVNFKIGAEKTHFALTGADLALWQESENTWGMRLKAVPIRTDANLTDTGQLRLSGTWKRSAVVRETPLQVSLEWKRGQAGQISKLVAGSDRGWRGELSFSAALSGTPASLLITADAAVEDLRRQDALNSGTLRLNSHCSASYSVSTRTFSGLDCIAPAGDGALELKGNASFAGSSWRQLSSYNLSLAANDIAAQSLLALARRANVVVPENLSAAGNLSGVLEMKQVEGSAAVMQGRGTLQALALASSSGPDISVGSIPFVVLSGALTSKHRVPSSRDAEEDAMDPRVEIGPVQVDLGGRLLEGRGTLSRAGYTASLVGDASLKRLLAAGRTLGLGVPPVSAEGMAAVALNLQRPWHDALSQAWQGTVQLRNVRAQVRGMNSPVEIASANLLLQDESVKVHNIRARAAGANWLGTMDIGRPCSAPDLCHVQFNLRAPELDSAALTKLLDPELAPKSWYRFLSLGSEQPPFLLQAHANGKVVIDALRLGNATAKNLQADLRLDAGRVFLSKFNTELLGGTLSGDVQANFISRPPSYSGAGAWEEISLEEIAALMHDGWAEGRSAGKFEFKAAGSSLNGLLHSADLRSRFQITGAIFPHIVLTSGSAPLHSNSFAGILVLRGGELLFQDAKLTSSAGVYTVAGTASLNGALDLRMTGDSMSSYELSGTVHRPVVSAIPAAQASLKP